VVETFVFMGLQYFFEGRIALAPMCGVGWLSSLPTEVVPLTGQYRISQLSDSTKAELVGTGWPQQMADDLVEVRTCRPALSD
jgi:hypothetical protein